MELGSYLKLGSLSAPSSVLIGALAFLLRCRGQAGSSDPSHFINSRTYLLDLLPN